MSVCKSVRVCERVSVLCVSMCERVCEYVRACVFVRACVCFHMRERQMEI